MKVPSIYLIIVSSLRKYVSELMKQVTSSHIESHRVTSKSRWVAQKQTKAQVGRPVSLFYLSLIQSDRI